MSKTKAPPKDAFGEPMVWVESYSGYLPDSINIDTAPIQHGVSGISHDGDMYCLDCAKAMNLVTVTRDGRLVALVKEKQETYDKEGEPTGDTRNVWVSTDFCNAPWTGKVLPRYESDTQYHCGRHKNCCNALDGDEHPYNHDLPVGIGIEQRIIQH